MKSFHLIRLFYEIIRFRLRNTARNRAVLENTISRVWVREPSSVEKEGYCTRILKLLNHPGKNPQTP